MVFDLDRIGPYIAALHRIRLAGHEGRDHPHDDAARDRLIGRSVPGRAAWDPGHHAASRARSISRPRSPGPSNPTDNRTQPAVRPISRRWSSGMARWVVVEGCVAIDLASPRLLEMSTIFNAFRKLNAADWLPRSMATTVPP